MQICSTKPCLAFNMFNGIRIQFQFLICVEKSINYAKLSRSQIIFVSKLCFKHCIRPFIFVIPIMLQILTSV